MSGLSPMSGLSAIGGRTRGARRAAGARVLLVALALAAGAPLAGGAVSSLAPGPARAADPAALDVRHVAPPDPGAPAVVWNGTRRERVVALTFDDGWNARALRDIYDILVRERVPATFFVTGVYVQRAPALWRRIAAAGFPLANHSYLHRDTTSLAPDLVARDLERTRQAVEEATHRPMLPYYRPPYGVRDAATDRLAAAAGFPYIVLWDTTGGDATHRPTVSSVVAGATAGRPGSIILLHAGPAVTPRALPAIIAAYRARGYRFATLPELLGAPTWAVPGSGIDPPPLGRERGRAPGGRLELAPDGRPGSRPRSLDGVDDEAAAAPLDVAPAVPPGGDAGPAPVPGARPAAPLAAGAPPGMPAAPAAAPSRPSATAPPARDAAWARRDGTPATVAGFTLVLLVVLLVAGAAAGRAVRSGGDPGP